VKTLANISIVCHGLFLDFVWSHFPAYSHWYLVPYRDMVFITIYLFQYPFYP